MKQQNVDSETGEVVPREDIARGYEVGKGQYLIVEDDEVEAVQVESTRTIEIDQFVPRDEIDDRYIDSPYYIAPDGEVGQDAFAVIRDTIGKMNIVALGRVVLTRREHVIALEPRGRGLLGMTLRYPYEVRDEQPYFEGVSELKLPKDMMDLASHIVSNKSGHFDPSHFEDRYENALIDLLKKKQAGEKIVPVRGARPPRVVSSEAAIECLRKAVRVKPDYADAMFNLALLLQGKNQFGEAANYWRRYLASDSQSDWAARARRSLKFCEMQVHWTACSVQTQTGNPDRAA